MSVHLATPMARKPPESPEQLGDPIEFDEVQHAIDLGRDGELDWLEAERWADCYLTVWKVRGEDGYYLTREDLFSLPTQTSWIADTLIPLPLPWEWEYSPLVPLAGASEPSAELCNYVPEVGVNVGLFFGIVLLGVLAARRLTRESTYCDGCKQFSRGPICPSCEEGS